MNKVIYKYEIPRAIDDDGLVRVELPQDHELLHVGAQGKRLFVWALVNPRSSMTTISFKVVETGVPFEIDRLYFTPLGTVLMNGGSLVWHVFLRS